MKKLRTFITITALSLFLSGMQSCYVHRDSDNYHHRGLFHRHDRDRDRDYDNGRDHRSGVILVNPERDHHDRDDRDHDRHD